MPRVFSNGYAVIIGVGADLPVTIRDANAIADLILDPTRCAYPKNQVRLLTGEGARRENIITSLNWLAESAGEKDTVILYYSGHGIETPDFFLVPYGFDRKELEDTAISGKAFTDLLRNIESRKLLVLLDCCHAGGQAEVKDAVKSPLPASFMNELRSSKGRVIIASSRKDELSWTGRSYSQFTRAILEALAGYGAFEEDGFSRVLDLALYAGRVVPERTGSKQHPIIKVSNLEDNFAIAWYAGGDKTIKPLTWTVDMHAVPALHNVQVTNSMKMLANYRANLMLIEERMSEYVNFTEVPLQLIKDKRQTEAKIQELESRLGQR